MFSSRPITVVRKKDEFYFKLERLFSKLVGVVCFLKSRIKTEKETTFAL